MVPAVLLQLRGGFRRATPWQRSAAELSHRHSGMMISRWKDDVPRPRPPNLLLCLNRIDGPTSILSHRDRFQSYNTVQVNAYFSGFQRAVTEAWDLNQFFNVNASFQPRLQARMASFCTQRSGHFNGFDQALVFTLPNVTFFQPPAFTHAMIADALAQAPNALAVDVSYAGGANAPNAGWLSASSQIAEDGSVLTVQVANMNPGGPDGSVTIGLPSDDSFTPSGTVVMHILLDPQADAASGRAPDMNAGNTPANPEYIAPTQQQLYWPTGSPTFTFTLPSFSFAVLYVYA